VPIELACDLVELAREVGDSVIVVVVKAPPALDTEPTIGDVLLNRPRRCSIVGELRIERIGDVS
jgi:hypothetical protein